MYIIIYVCICIRTWICFKNAQKVVNLPYISQVVDFRNTKTPNFSKSNWLVVYLPL